MNLVRLLDTNLLSKVFLYPSKPKRKLIVDSGHHQLGDFLTNHFTSLKLFPHL